MDGSAISSHSAIAGALTVNCQGEAIRLLPDRAVLRPATRTLIVADTHFGKAASFRSAGVPIPSGTTAADLDRLSELLRATQATRLVILGDFLHARSGRTRFVMEQLAVWCDAWKSVQLELILGNHDRCAGLLPPEWNLRVHTHPLCAPPFVYAHHPVESADGYVLCGHLHPAFTLRDRVTRSHTLPCFWFTQHYGVLPAFGGFTGTMRVRPSASDQVYLAGPGEVVPLPARMEGPAAFGKSPLHGS